MKLPAISLFGYRLYSGSRDILLKAFADPYAHAYLTISYLNAHAVVLASLSTALRDAYLKVDVLVADGRSMSWTAMAAGTPISEVITGSELFEDLLHLAADHGWRICLVGYDAELLETTMRQCRDHCPDAQFADSYVYPSPFPEEELGTEGLATHLRRNGAEVVFLGLGSPYQELMMNSLCTLSGLRLLMCTGASFSYFTGQLHRPPLWVSRLGLEWFWRLVHEPRRLWRRYTLGLFRFIRLALHEILAHRIH